MPAIWCCDPEEEEATRRTGTLVRANALSLDLSDTFYSTGFPEGKARFYFLVRSSFRIVFLHRHENAFAEKNLKSG